jgi:hypothetical protein
MKEAESLDTAGMASTPPDECHGAGALQWFSICFDLSALRSVQSAIEGGQLVSARRPSRRKTLPKKPRQ